MDPFNVTSVRFVSHPHFYCVSKVSISYIASVPSLISKSLHLYLERESNPHGPYGPTDFKSVLSTYSNTQASISTMSKNLNSNIKEKNN